MLAATGGGIDTRRCYASDTHVWSGSNTAWIKREMSRGRGGREGVGAGVRIRAGVRSWGIG